MSHDKLLCVGVLLLMVAACQTRSAPDGSRAMGSKDLPLAAALGARDPIRVEPLEAAGSPPVYVLRGKPRGPARLAFLHGMCGHGLGYAQSFAFSAAKRGTLIAPQGDVSCDDGLAKWSADIEALDARITRTFQALGDPDPQGDVAIIGMSMGATRAAELVKRYPQRYTRLISMAAPSAIKPGELRSLRSAVMMAGERDRQDLMRESERALTGSGVPTTFILIPDAVHGAMGSAPEQTMAEAFEWLFSH